VLLEQHGKYKLEERNSNKNIMVGEELSLMDFIKIRKKVAE